MPILGEQRYEAEWIEAQFFDECGEWDPDRDIYAASYHQTKEEAQAAAITAAKLTGIEWVRVALQQYGRYGWDDLLTWTGDFDGLHDEPIRCEAA